MPQNHKALESFENEYEFTLAELLDAALIEGGCSPSPQLRRVWTEKVSRVSDGQDTSDS